MSDEIDYWDPAPVGTVTEIESVDENGVAVLVDRRPILYGEGPTFSADPWKIVFLDGNGTPGLCTVHAQPQLAIDKKKSGGIDGAVITVNGVMPGPVDIDVVLWTQEQWSFFQALVPKIWRKPGKTKGADLALDVGHPGFQLWGVKSVVVKAVGVPEQGPIPQSILIKLRCVEFIPLGKKNVTNTVKSGAKVPLAPELRPKNEGGDPPSKTDIGPSGPPVDHTAGAN